MNNQERAMPAWAIEELKRQDDARAAERDAHAG